MAMEFTGEAGNQEISLGTINPLSGLSAGTWTAWANPDAIGVGNPTVIMGKGNTTGNATPWKIQMQDGTNALRGILDTGAGGDPLDAATAFAAGVWTFVAMVYDGSNKRLYFDAVQDATEAQTGNIVTSADTVTIASINVSGTPRREWDGLIDDVRIYNRALSLAELQTMFALKGRDRIFRGLVNRWRMAERGEGQTATVASSVRDWGSAPFNGSPVASPTYRAGILRY